MAEQVNLFAYGTLQLGSVQQGTFGRLLDGTPDRLAGYVLAPLTINDPNVVALSGAPVHQIARRSGRPGDVVPGTIFRITEAELAAADSYEVDVYARIEATLESGARACLYVGPDLAGAE